MTSLYAGGSSSCIKQLPVFDCAMRRTLLANRATVNYGRYARNQIIDADCAPMHAALAQTQPNL